MFWKWINKERKKVDPTWYLVDPRPIAEEHPDTFWLPSSQVIGALKSGDLVKLIFHLTHPTTACSAERMWCILSTVSRDRCTGFLNNVPQHIDNLRLDELIEFERYHIIDIETSNQTH
jgi:hypothetical protein